MNIFNITKASSRSLLLFLLVALAGSLSGAETAKADDVDYIISMSKACRQIRREVFDIVKAAVEQTSKYGSAEEVSSAILQKNRPKLQELANRYIQETPYLDVVAFFDGNGDFLAMNTVDHEGRGIPEAALQKITRKSFSGVPVISECLKNKTISTIVDFQRQCDFTPALFGSSGLSVAISSEVTGKAGGPKTGVVSTRLNFQRIIKVLNENERGHPELKVYLINEHGDYYDEEINRDVTQAPLSPESLRKYLDKFEGAPGIQNIFSDEAAFHLQIMKLNFDTKLRQKNLFLLVFSKK
jgi:hypothetical protein